LGQVLGFPMVAGEAAEIDVIRGDGATAVAEMRVVDIEWGGQPAFLASLRDITQRKQMERALRESNARTNTILESISDGFFSLNKDLVVTYFNAAAERLLGRRSEEVLGRNVFDAFPEAQGSIFEENYRRAIQEQIALSFETYFGPEPYTNWYDVRVYPHADGISVYFQIVTEQKRAEETLLWRARTDAAIAELSKALLTQRTLDDISLLILEHAKELTGSAFGYVGYIDPETGYLISSTMTRDIWDDCHVADKDVVFKEFGGLWGWVLEHRQPMLTNAPSQDSRSSGVPQGHLPIERFLSAPALINQELVGQIALANPDRDYTDQDLELVERLASLYALAVHRQRAEEALAESERRLDQMLQTMVDGMVVVDTEGEIIYANPAAEQILRPGTRGVTGRSYDERTWRQIDTQGNLFPPDQLPLSITLRDQRPVEKLEHGIVTNGDEARWLSVSSAPLRDEGGRLYGAVASFRDITERKQAEKRIAHLNAVLRAIRKVDQLIVTEKDREALLQGICDILIETRGYQDVYVLLTNEAGEVVQSIGADGVQDVSATSLPACVEKTLSQAQMLSFKIPDAICHDCEQAELHRGDNRMAICLEHRGKRYGIISVTLPDLPSAEQEEIVLFEEMAGDIAFALHNIELEEEQREMEHQLQSYTNQLEQLVAEKVKELELERAKTIHTAKLASLGEMATGVAHELNQPLTSMLFDADYLKTLASQIRDRGDPDAALDTDEVYEIAGNLADDITRCRKIINHLRAFGRVSAGHATSIDLNQIIQDSFILVGERLRQHDVTVELDLAPNLPPILADPNRIEQVFLNLISNAEYAMGKMEERIASGEVERAEYRKRLGISTRRENDTVVARVEDTGIGISEEHQEHLFEPFFTTKPVGEGTGLGLSISYGIIHEVGGEILCQSAENEGAAFHLRFPVGERTE
jgi:PAS domain S-box-containing protein